MRDHDAFVVACEPIARQEVRRLMRLGVRMEHADAMQHALLSLLPRRASFASAANPGAWARVIIRQALIKEYAERAQAVKRGGGGRRDRCRPRAPVAHMSVDNALLTVPSHEDYVIERVDRERIIAAFPLPPRDGGVSRQALQQRGARWVRHVTSALNDTPDRIKEAA